tara:strand:- start:210 stop:341 length:132 start_codon:yes stop_codon:yes gene_type:complete
MDGMGSEIKRKAVEAVMGRQRGVRMPWLEMVECELYEGKEFVP